VGKLPYDGNEDEMITMDSVSDSNQIVLAFCLHAD